jgi:hypothetical protein
MQFVVDSLQVDVEARRQAFEDHDQPGTMRFTRRQKTQHLRAIVAEFPARFRAPVHAKAPANR